VQVDAAVQKYLALYPVPSGCAPGDDVCPFVFNGQQIVNENFFTPGSTTNSPKRTPCTAPTLRQDALQLPIPSETLELNTLSSRQIFAAEETHSFTPTFVNAVRFGYNHENVTTIRV